MSRGSDSCDASHAALNVLKLKAEGLKHCRIVSKSGTESNAPLSDYAKKRFAYQTFRRQTAAGRGQMEEMDGGTSCNTLQPHGVCVMSSLKALNGSQLGEPHFKYLEYQA